MINQCALVQCERFIRVIKCSIMNCNSCNPLYYYCKCGKGHKFVDFLVVLLSMENYHLQNFPLSEYVSWEGHKCENALKVLIFNVIRLVQPLFLSMLGMMTT